MNSINFPNQVSADGCGRVVLVTGPARSGKSEWAELLADQSGQPVVYMATGQVDGADPEWQARIQAHQQRRPSDWTTVEVTEALPEAVRAADVVDTVTGGGQCLLIDSLGTWVTNQLPLNDLDWREMQADFLRSLTESRSTIILVAEEVGWGVVPAYPLGRQFRDRLGRLTRAVGEIAATVYLVTGGYVLDLTQLGRPLDRQELTGSNPQNSP